MKIRVLGTTYAVVVERDSFQLDWLDRILLDSCTTPVTVHELLATLGAVPTGKANEDHLTTLPRRVIEDALGRLLGANRVMLNVAAGTVERARTDLPGGSSVRVTDTIQVWQDFATGLLLLPDDVASWAPRRPRLQPPGQRPPTGQRRDWARTQVDDAYDETLAALEAPKSPMAMSEAEIFHALARLRVPFLETARLVSCERVDRMDLRVNALRRDDGRIAILDDLPWMLRQRWIRLPGASLSTESIQAAEVLPPEWPELVGVWESDAWAAVAGTRSPRVDPPEDLLHAARLDLRPSLQHGGNAITRGLVRDAALSVVVVASGRTTVGQAIQVLKEATVKQRTLVAVGPPVREDKRNELRDDGILVVPVASTPGAASVDLVLVDGRTLILGGVAPAANRVVVLRGAQALLGVTMWLQSLKVRPEGVEGPNVEKPHDGAIPLLELVEGVTSLLGELGDPLAPDDLRERVRTELATVSQELRARPARPTRWISAGEPGQLLGVEPRPVRVVARGAGPLVATAQELGIECVIWPEFDGPVDVVLWEDAVVLGFASGRSSGAGPDWLGIRDRELAALLRQETALLGRPTQ